MKNFEGRLFRGRLFAGRLFRGDPQRREGGAGIRPMLQAQKRRRDTDDDVLLFLLRTPF